MQIKFNKKSVALALAGVMLAGGVVGGTLAWLTAESDTVENTFTTSNIGLELDETDRIYQMIPGWTIEKDPNTYVVTGSEDCYLFVKVEESSEEIVVGTTKYGFDDFLTYSIDTQWTALEDEDGNTIDGVYYMVIDEDTKKGEDQKYNILGAGKYKDVDNNEYSWTANQVLTKPEVTKAMMDAVTMDNQPKLTFTAYAVQLWKSNKPEDLTNETAVETAKFKPYEAWAKVSTN